MTDSSTWDLIVVGGGAAGLWAAGTAAARGKRVLVLEKNNKPGVKILMSGGTRCNITHHCDIGGIMEAFGKQGRFLKHALHTLAPNDVVAQFHQLGVETKIESTGKVFPVSNRAIDVRDALVRRLNDFGARLQAGVAVTNVCRSEQGRWQVATAEHIFESEKLLLCCGGLSYPGCGTTGDGYAWAKAVGHSIVDTYPSLTPLVSHADWVRSLQGVTLPDVEVRVSVAGEKSKDPRHVSRGGFLWTHFGCSGPTPMNVSRFVSELPDPSKASLSIDLVPDVEESKIVENFAAASHGRRLVATAVHEFLPKSMAECLCIRAGVREGLTLAELPKKARLSLVEDLKRLRVPLHGTRGYAKAEVTRGGVATSEINPQTMESRLMPGLFLAGEILDLDGPIGGFNFQAAFSTGHLAALNV